MPEISDDQYAKLMKRSAGYGQLKTQYSELRRQFDELDASHTDVTNTLEALDGEATQLRAQIAAAPANADERVASLTTELRNLRHRSAFDKLAQGKVNPAALDDAWSLSGYKPEADEIDETALGSIVDELVGKRAYLAFTPADGSAAPPPAKPGAPIKTPPAKPLTPTEGADRGGAANQAALDARSAVDAKYASTGRASDVPGRI